MLPLALFFTQPLTAAPEFNQKAWEWPVVEASKRLGGLGAGGPGPHGDHAHTDSRIRGDPL